ncbi:MAG: hypothetical protein CMN01_04100 [Rickettsiales bacterium]|nr:hypothetical protein [Rickettsiales bacterium]|tara:strand:+ start:1661 stop:2119 length:459 start_codon:yes stop_codon:yes gene_type:complete
MITKQLTAFLTAWIIENTEFKKELDAPDFFVLTKDEMSNKACFSTKNCRVKAYYVKDSGIYYIDKLNPEQDICDQSIILHELVHHYQKNRLTNIDLDEQTLWTLQERQAIYYQNLFLISQKRKNDNKGPENVLQCEGGSYLDLQYKFNDSTQ